MGQHCCTATAWHRWLCTLGLPDRDHPDHQPAKELSTESRHWGLLLAELCDMTLLLQLYGADTFQFIVVASVVRLITRLVFRQSFFYLMKVGADT